MTDGPNVRYLVLWPTASCDLDCVYCYRQIRNGATMSQEVVDRALALAWKSAERTRLPFHVQISGGEPTLVADVVEYVAQETRRLGGSCGIQTNGTRMDAALAGVLAEYKVQVGVSVDGPPAIQQILRGKAEATYCSLDLLASRGIPVRVTAVLSAGNVSHLAELVLSLAVFPNIRGFALDPLVRLGSANARDDLTPAVEETVCAIERLHAALQVVNRRRRSPLVWREQENVRRALRQTGNTSIVNGSACCTTLALKGKNNSRPYCHAMLGESLAVAPNGDVYPCSQSVGDVGSAAGNLDRIDTQRLKERYQGVTLSGPCDSCLLAGRCPQDCPSRVESQPFTDDTMPITCAIYDTLARLEEVS